MMDVFVTALGTTVTLPQAPFGQGGFGSVYRHPSYPHLAIKIVNEGARTTDYFEKIAALLGWPVKDPSFAFPTGFVLSGLGGERIGFTMPWLEGVPFLTVIDDGAASRLGVAYDNLSKLEIAADLAAKANKFHRVCGILLGDANESNLLVSPPRAGSRWSVSFVDPDGWEFSYRNSQGQFVRARAGGGKEPYLAPELQGLDLAAVERTEDQDVWAVHELVWMILRGGAFSHSVTGPAPLPPLGERIRAGLWPIAPQIPLPADWHSVESGIAFDSFPPKAKRSFEKTFHDGFKEPGKRARAKELSEALSEWVRAEEVKQAPTSRIPPPRSSPVPPKNGGAAVAIAGGILVACLLVFALVAASASSRENKATPPTEAKPAVNGTENNSSRFKEAPKLFQEALKPSSGGDQ